MLRSLRGRTTAHDRVLPPTLAQNHLNFCLWLILMAPMGSPAPLAAFTALVTSCCRNADGARRLRVERAPCKSACFNQPRTWGLGIRFRGPRRWDGLRPLMKRESVSGSR
jgi:hypothetical protein